LRLELELRPPLERLLEEPDFDRPPERLREDFELDRVREPELDFERDFDPLEPDFLVRLEPDFLVRLEPDFRPEPDFLDRDDFDPLFFCGEWELSRSWMSSTSAYSRLRSYFGSCSSTISPSWITPRQAPDSTSCISMKALNRERSARTARLVWRIPRAAFSISEPGSTSSETWTRVRLGASSWKVTTPVWETPWLTFHWIRSSGRCSTISATNSFDIPHNFARKETVQSSSCVTRSIRCMNSAQSSNWVHWL
jgi:hypothetical protein